MESNRSSTENRLDALHPVKSMVTFAEAESCSAMLPTGSGKEAGLVITGVQANPDVCVSVRPVMRARRAGPAPLLDRVTVQTRAEYGPDFADICADKAGRGPILAVTATGPVMFAVALALVLSTTGPDQDTKA